MYAPILKKVHDPFSCIINVSERNIIYFWHYCDTIKKIHIFRHCKLNNTRGKKLLNLNEGKRGFLPCICSKYSLQYHLITFHTIESSSGNRG